MLPADHRVPSEILNSMSDECRTCVVNLLQYFSNLESKYPDLSDYPQSGLAGVLVLLYEVDGILRVLLTTRSKQLRTHAGQTALPGGKKDTADDNIITTALREAHEEVGLPLNCPSVFVLGLLEPFISLHRLLVTPVVALLSDSNVISSLKPAQQEVAHIFSHPMKALLQPELAKSETLVPIGGDDWPYETELHSTTDSVVQMLNNTTYRMHRFRSSASPIKGLTSDILLKTSEISFGKPPEYERYAPGQLENIVDIIQSLKPAERIQLS